MRFTVAWANVVSENLVLKLSLGCLCIVLIALAAVTVKLVTRKPLVVERACYSHALPTNDGERTPAEVEIFVREALAMRFDTTAQIKPGFLSDEELRFRTQEQQDFKKRDLSQRILINSVSVNGDKVTVNADRIFTVGTVRSALPFSLIVTLGSVARTEWNPYGLSVVQVSAPILGQSPEGAKK